MSFIKNIASDLLVLEVNTIIKANMSATKAPASMRKLLKELADLYRETMTEYHENAKTYFDLPNAAAKTTFRWRFGGKYSFQEIQSLAIAGADMLTEFTKKMPEGKARQEIFGEIRMLERISTTALRVVEMFDARMQEYKEEFDAKKEGFSPDQPFVNFTSAFQSYPSHLASLGWNNDISENDFKKVADMEINPDQISLLRKAYEIGTSQIMLQTIIQVDGDITSYISRTFLNQPDDIQATILNLHNDSLQNSTRFWRYLFDAVVMLAGQSFDKIFSKKK